ncbi:MAG: hypothetical protein Q4E45_08000 [Eubacteriales bacterium]|nr:hypothetical protein [Eubacteriales bacterium]
MINRYEGNTGRVVRLAEADDRRPPPPFPPPPPPRFPPPGPPPRPSADPLSRLFSGLGELESGDLLMLLVLWLLYRESGDQELLLIMAAAFLF